MFKPIQNPPIYGPSVFLSIIPPATEYWERPIWFSEFQQNFGTTGKDLLKKSTYLSGA